MFSNRHYFIYILVGVLIVLSLSAVGAAAEGSEYDYERDAPENASSGDTIEVTIEVGSEGEVIEKFDSGLIHPEITASSATEAYVQDGEVIASFDEPGTLTYTVEVEPLIADGGVVEYNITAAGSLEAPDTIVKVDTGSWGDGTIGLDGVINAINDWRAGEISLEKLKEVITAWRTGETVE